MKFGNELIFATPTVLYMVGLDTKHILFNWNFQYFILMSDLCMHSAYKRFIYNV